MPAKLQTFLEPHRAEYNARSSMPVTSKVVSLQTEQIKIGTRGSPLALAQAHETRDRLCAAHDLDPALIEVVVISTTGDRIQNRPLAEIGGKGLFTRELEEQLHDGSIDMAVHSMKDMPAVLPDGLEICCLLEREDPRDAFMSPVAGTIADLPPGATVGSSWSTSRRPREPPSATGSAPPTPTRRSTPMPPTAGTSATR